MNVPKKRKNNTMSEDEPSVEPSPTKIDPNATLVSPRRSIRSYSNESSNYTRSNEGVNFISHIIRTFIIYTLKPTLFSKLFFYAALILTLGLFRDYVLLNNLLPNDVQTLINSFKVADRSWFNTYTVKIGWFWTLISTVPFMLYTRHELAKRDSKKLNENRNMHFFTRLIPCVIRVAIMTFIWYLSVEFFVFYADKNGECKLNPATKKEETLQMLKILNRKECKRNGHTWINGFDISGHIFLMVFSNLVRYEEFIYLIKYFEEFSEFRYMKYARDRIQNYCSPYAFRFSVFHIRCFVYLFVFFSVTVVWDFMIIQTSLFYHSLSQKVIGFLWAVFSWFATYKVLYPQTNLTV